jgi:hypothetical protein
VIPPAGASAAIIDLVDEQIGRGLAVLADLDAAIRSSRPCSSACAPLASPSRALIACMRRLLVILNAILKTQQPPRTEPITQ